MPNPEPQPADPGAGFPNPHADHFDGERTPEEQVEYDRQQALRDAGAGAGEIGGEPTTEDAPPPNPSGTPGAAY